MTPAHVHLGGCRACLMGHVGDSACHLPFTVTSYDFLMPIDAPATPLLSAWCWWHSLGASPLHRFLSTWGGWDLGHSHPTISIRPRSPTDLHPGPTIHRWPPLTYSGRHSTILHKFHYHNSTIPFDWVMRFSLPPPRYKSIPWAIYE